MGAVPLLAAHGVQVKSGESLVARIDDAVPGPRAIAWAGAVAVAAIVIGIAVALASRSRG